MTSGGGPIFRKKILVAAAAAMLGVAAPLAAHADDDDKPRSNIRIGSSQLEPVDWVRMDGWADDDHAVAFATFMTSCKAILRASPSSRPERPVFRGLHEACTAAADVKPADAKAARTFFEEHFRPVRITPLGETAGFLTGYYEPIVDGSLERTDEYTHPLYRTPSGLKSAGKSAKSKSVTARAKASKAKARGKAKKSSSKSSPTTSLKAAAKSDAHAAAKPADKAAAKSAAKAAAKSATKAAKSAKGGNKKTARKRGRKGSTSLDRAAIEDGALSGRNLEIVYLKDPIDSFFIHIQGSARVRLSDGGMMRVNYDSQNGHPYTAVGRFLIDRNIVPKEEMSMDRIRQWMTANPEEGEELRRLNKSYVFFRQTGLAENEEPVGAQGVSLTPGRSIAVDRNLHVYGTPFFIQAELPIESEEPTTRWRRLMVAQDTGGAIVGPARADIYYGAGEPAGTISGRFKQPGQFVMLFPRSVDPFAALREIPLPKPRPSNIPGDDVAAKPAAVAAAPTDTPKPAAKPADAKKSEAKPDKKPAAAKPDAKVAAKPSEAKKDDGKPEARKPSEAKNPAAAKQANVKPADKPADAAKPAAKKPEAKKPEAKKPEAAAPKRKRDIDPSPPT